MSEFRMAKAGENDDPDGTPNLFRAVSAETEKRIEEIRELRRQEDGMDSPVKRLKLREKRMKLLRKLLP